MVEGVEADMVHTDRRLINDTLPLLSPISLFPAQLIFGKDNLPRKF